MARLRVRLQGKLVQELQLAEERSYLVGRREDCDIVLTNERGISREHFKISFADGHWQLEVLSKYGDVISNGEKIQTLSLQGPQVFFLQSYEFEYTETSSDLVPVNHQSSQPAQNRSATVEEPYEEVEKTFVGASSSVPFVKVVDDIGSVKELFKLEGGDTWIAGREASCDIVIRDQRVSRRQFEIRRQGSQYLIIDLGSVNGTLLNGSPISSTEALLVKSSDAITVLDNHLYFELHDPDFKARMEMVRVAPASPLVPLSEPSQVPMNYYPQSMVPGGPIPHEMPYPINRNAAPQGKKKFDFEKHRIKLIIGAVVLLAVAYTFSDNEGSKPVPAAAGVAQKPSEMFSKLPAEKQILVKQTYQLAKNLYMQGKYELAKAEVVKIYEIVPEYEDVKDVERLANEALAIQEQKRIQEQREKAAAEQEEKIQNKVSECKGQITPDTTMDQLDECISPVLQFNPEHAAILELRHQVEALVAQKQAQDAQKKDYQEQVAKLKGLYSRAEATHKSNQYLKAIKDYQVVTASKLPDPSGLKAEARRNIASIQQTLKQKTEQFGQEADKLYKDQKLRDSILTLRKATEVDPTNDETKEKIEKYVLELKKQMMILYQEGVLEESYGNVEGSDSRPGAKDKWKKIMDLDIPDGEYYGKAKIKLKKYGVL